MRIRANIAWWELPLGNVHAHILRKRFELAREKGPGYGPREKID
jgi:hypothetical protein